MKRKNLEKCLKKTIAMALTLTLTVPMTMPALGVEAQEVNVQENDVQEMEALADLQLEENDVEVVEDMDYVVYIDTSEQIDGTEDKDFVEEEISISHNTVSENTVLNESNKEQEYIVEYNSEDVETLQESIEKAEEILSEEGAELIKDEETIIYTADLTQGEIEELQESEASIIVEENIELFGASKKSQINAKKDTKKEKKEGNKKSTKETTKSEKEKEKVDKQKDSNKKKSEAYELKMALKQSSSETEEKEPEWNVNMVNGDVVGQMEGDIVKVAVMDSGIELLSGIPVQQISNLVATEQDLPYYMILG